MNALNDKIDDLAYSDEYAEYIMKHGDRLCCNGDMLLDLMKDGYLFDQFLVSKGYNENSVSTDWCSSCG